MAEFLLDSPLEVTVTGYHGTSEALAVEIARKGFTPSTGAGEWLGHGVYFWESQDAAYLWAQKKHSKRPCVVRATLLLGYCLYLDEVPPLWDYLREIHHELMRRCREGTQPFPEDRGDDKRLSCELFNLAALNTHPPADSVVRVCPQGETLPGTDLSAGSRRQICMRRTENILYPKRLLVRE